MTTTHTDELTDLAAELAGDVARPGDPGYALASPWNVAVPRRPRAVVLAADAGDVARTVRFAGRHRLQVAVQATGHGAVPVDDDVLLLHTGRLTDQSADSRWPGIAGEIADRREDPPGDRLVELAELAERGGGPRDLVGHSSSASPNSDRTARCGTRARGCAQNCARRLPEWLRFGPSEGCAWTTSRASASNAASPSAERTAG